MLPPTAPLPFFCRLRKQLSCRSPKCALPLAKLSLLSPSVIQGCIREANKSRVVVWHLAIRQHYKPSLAYLLKKVNYLYSHHSPVQAPLLWILSKPQTKTLKLVVSRVQAYISLITSENLGPHISTAVLSNQQRHLPHVCMYTACMRHVSGDIALPTFLPSPCDVSYKTGDVCYTSEREFLCCLFS